MIIYQENITEHAAESHVHGYVVCLTTDYAKLEVSKPTPTNHIVVYLASDMPVNAFHFTVTFTASSPSDSVETDPSYVVRPPCLSYHNVVVNVCTKHDLIDQGQIIDVFGGVAGSSNFAFSIAGVYELIAY